MSESILYNYDSEEIQEVEAVDPLKDCVYIIADEADSSSDVCIVDDDSCDVLYTSSQVANRVNLKNKNNFGAVCEVSSKQVNKKKKKNKKNYSAGVKDTRLIGGKVFANKIKNNEKESSKEFKKLIKQRIVEGFLERLRKSSYCDKDKFSSTNGDNLLPENTDKEISNKRSKTNRKNNISTGTEGILLPKTNDDVERSSKSSNIKIKHKKYSALEYTKLINVEEVDNEKINNGEEKLSKESNHLKTSKIRPVDRFFKSLKISNNTNNLSSTDKDHPTKISNDDFFEDYLSEQCLGEILLLAWEIEIDKQKDILSDSKKIRRKRRKTCDCEKAFKTLFDYENSYETKRRVNYLSLYTCCKFRKALLGSVYYVPKRAETAPLSSSKKRNSTRKENKLSKSSSSDNVTNECNHNIDNIKDNDNDKNLIYMDSFDKLIGL